MLPNRELLISPANPNHKRLEYVVLDYLQERGYSVTSSTYHDVMPKDVKTRLSRVFTFTSLYVRGRADRLAIHNTKDIVFEWEAKTHANSKYSDLTIEVLPLLHHFIKSWLNVRCLYVISVNGKEGGFWVDALPPIREIRIPNSLNWEPLHGQLLEAINFVFHNPKIINPSPSNGSGDPFVVIDKTEVENMPHWKTLIP